MSVNTCDYSYPSHLYSIDSSPPPSPPKNDTPFKQGRHRRKSFTEDPRVPKEQIYTARPKSSTLHEDDLNTLVKLNSLPALKVEEPRLTVKDFAIQARVMQKIISDSMTPHAHITTLNILTLLQRKAQTMSEETHSKIIAVIRDKLGLISGDLSYCIQQNLNVPTYRSKSNEYCLDLRRLQTRAKTIDSLAQILIPYMNHKELEKVENSADFVCIFPRINNLLSEEKKLTITLFSPFLDLKKASRAFTSHFPDLATEIKNWISNFESLPEIEELDLSSTYIHDIPEEICKCLTHIKKFRFHDNKSISAPILVTVSTFTSLEEIDLSNNNFTDLPLTFFDTLPNLRVLNLRNNSLAEETLSQIQDICNHKSIDLLI
jgi:hypothetical protein